MAEKTALPTIPLLSGDNYFNWRIKMESVLQLKRLKSVLTSDRPTGDAAAIQEWDEKNADAIACIQLSLSDSQTLQFANVASAKQLWTDIHDAHIGPAEDRAINAGEELKNLRMLHNESACEYVSRARGLAVKCASSNLNVSERQLVYNVVRGLNNNFSQIREILKTQRDKKLDEVLEILREREREFQAKNNGNNQETAYATKNSSKRYNHGKCYVCGKPGHIARNCHQRQGVADQKPSEQQKNNRKYKNKSSGQNKNVNFVTENKVEYASFQADNDSSWSRVNRNQWIVDSGCTSHMTFEKSQLEHFKPIKSKVYLAGKDNALESEGVGSVKVKVDYNKSKTTYITVHDVIYVPKLRSNLLSVMKLIENGLKVNFTGYEVSICKNNNEIITTGKRINNQFVVYMTPVIDDICNSVNNQNNIDKASDTKYDNNVTNVWHRRLGHINDNYLKRIIDEKMVNGVHVKLGNTNCDACKVSKITRKPHKSVLHNQSNDTLDLLHIDICGPMPVVSSGGSRYILLIIDDYSGMYFTYFLKSKDETLSVLQTFNEKCKNKLSKGIKCIRTDNGTEFTNKQFNEFVSNEGIEHQKTVPYNPESNGKVERGNRVIIERARTLLYESKLPLSFWGEAVAYITHTVNLNPRRNKSKTPYELWYKRVPNISYLRTFGCVAYYHVPKCKRTKLQPSGRKAIMVGYSRDRVAYRLFDLQDRCIIEERNVFFDEVQKGNNYLKEFTDNNDYFNWNFDEPVNTINNDDRENIDVNKDVDAGKRDDNVDDSEIESSETDDENNGENVMRNVNVNSRGRPKGVTMADSLKQREKNLRDREERLKKEGVRRSERLSKTYNANLVDDVYVPCNFNEAINDINCEEWKNAMEDELKSLNEYDVWDVCEYPKDRKTVKSKWIFSTKRIDNNVIKFKARLVATGYNQIKGKDYEESYSPVINIDSWRALIAIAAKKNLNIRFFDVKTAYLNSELKEIVYLEPPPGFENIFGEGNICKLKKGLYGLPQSGRNWYYKLKKELSENGLEPLASESCVFIAKNEECFFVLGSYVDDFTVIDNNNRICEKILKALRKRIEIKETTQSKNFLGICVECDKTGIYLSQTDYIDKLLNKYGMTDCKTTGTPIVRGEDSVQDNDDNNFDMLKYQELIGGLLYLANRTRPDIVFAMSYLSQYNHCPTERHYKLAKRVLRYLRGSKYKRLYYDRKSGSLRAYSDSSWGNGEGGKSFSGGVTFIGNSLISWKCKKQRTVADSTCIVELCAISEIVKDVLWMQNMLIELKCIEFINRPTEMFCDNQATIQWLKNAKSSVKTRHVNLKFHFVRDEIEREVISLKYINTDRMIADCFTKAVTKEKLIWSCKQLGLI